MQVTITQMRCKLKTGIVLMILYFDHSHEWGIYQEKEKRPFCMSANVYLTAEEAIKAYCRLMLNLKPEEI